MVNEEVNPWKVLHSHKVYENKWIRVDEHKVIDPNGNNGIYSVVHFQNLAIGIIPLDKDYNTWIVGQYRFPLNEYSWEIPEGGGDMKLNPLESARRELLEETGIKAKDWMLIQQMNTSNSATDEHALIYLARDLSFYQPEPEETERLQIMKIPFDELYYKAMKGEIKDGISLVAIFKVKMMIDAKLI